jgi:hypothetical protein
MTKSSFFGRTEVIPKGAQSKSARISLELWFGVENKP